MDTYLPDRDLVDAEKRKWLYINVATAIKNKVKPNDDSWNTASHEQLAQRADYEKRLIDLLKMGVVKDENHLLEMISKL
jgi:hypothetical protein